MKIANMRTRIKLGVFVICVGIVAGLCLLLAGDEVSFFKKTRSYQAHFKNTSGLIEGAPVQIGGVEVGRVAQIVIEAEGTLAIAATLRIDSPYFDLISRNSSVALETQGLLGDKFVSLIPGSNGSNYEPLSEGELIATREDQGLTKMVERSSLIVDQVTSTTRKIDDFASGLPDAETMRAATIDFRESTKALRILMTQMAARDSFISTLNDAESRKMLQNSLASMESATAHFDSIVRKIDSGQGTMGALVNDRTIYEDMRSILGRIDRGKIARRVFIEAAQEETPVQK